MTGAVGPFPRLAGTASALFGFIQSAIAAVVGQVAMRLQGDVAWVLACTVAISAILLLVTAIVAGSYKPQEASNQL
jgi:DHA1 family bicyclomycin/chloramphenicol resistance-like MFS transporter